MDRNRPPLLYFDEENNRFCIFGAYIEPLGGEVCDAVFAYVDPNGNPSVSVYENTSKRIISLIQMVYGRVDRSQPINLALTPRDALELLYDQTLTISTWYVADDETDVIHLHSAKLEGHARNEQAGCEFVIDIRIMRNANRKHRRTPTDTP